MRISGWSSDVCSSDLARYRQECASKRFSEISAVDKTQGKHPGRKGVDIDDVRAQRVGDVIEAYLHAEENQKHQDKIGDAADKRRIGRRHGFAGDVAR